MFDAKARSCHRRTRCDLWARWLATAGWLVALLAPLANGQGGYDTRKYPDLGIELPVPRSYEEVPTQPDEKWTVIHYAERIPKDDDKRKRVRPELQIVWIDTTPKALPTQPPAGNPGDIPPPPPPSGTPASEDSKAAKLREPDSFETYLAKIQPSWRHEERREGVAREGWKRFDAKLTQTVAARNSGAGRVSWFEGHGRVIVLFGTCAPEHVKDHEKIWRTMADKLVLSEPEAVSITKWKEYYAKRPFLDVDYRAGVRASLVRGWSAEDTPNYILIHNTKDQPLIRLIASELEAMRREYERLFPPSAPVTAVSAVRVCRDQDAYRQYGGPAGSGGYWNWVAKELVFYDYENVDGKANTGKANSRIVLYHEAFHQYIFYSCGELAPHSWYNEGTGDYFSGAQISGGKVARIGVNPWRIRTIQAAIEKDRWVRWEKIVRYEQSEYYADAALCYAQGWSMIYFLRTSKVVERHPQWSQILPKYLDTLKSVWASELAALKASNLAADAREKGLAQVRARTAAVEHAFAGIDYGPLEAAWRDFTLDLKAPKD